MRVLLTGYDGYIGAVLTPLLIDAGHEVVGLDMRLYAGCDFSTPHSPRTVVFRDLRDLRASDMDGFDAVIHLAALSNDPLGDLNAAVTYEINHEASVRLAQLAKAGGVRRFVFASSCSLYGIAGDDLVTEDAPFNPVTAYGESKVLVERDLSQLAGDRFSPVFLRNATAFGASPKLRLDLVVNQFVALAVTTGEVLVMSDGTPWRPLVHVEDIARAFVATLVAPIDRIHNRAFNVGRTADNFQVRDIAERVAAAVPGVTVRYADGGGPDPRCYRVACERITTAMPEFAPVWSLDSGIAQLRDEFRRLGLSADDVQGAKFMRIRRIREHLQHGRLDEALRWVGIGQGAIR